MSTDAFERKEEIIKLKAKLELARKSVDAGDPIYTVEKSKARLEEIYTGKS